MSFLAALRHAVARLAGDARAHLAIEAGERGVRLLLARREGKTFRVRRVLSADLRADGLLSPGEMAARLRALLAALPAAPATLVLPAGRVHSQLMALRPGESRAVADLARAVGGRQFEAVPSVFDARPLRPAGRLGRPMWVSIAREADVEIHLLRCGLPAERVSAVIGADASLAAAFVTLPDRPPVAVLIELGATSGLLVVVEADQPAFAADFDWGLEQLATALAADLGCTTAAAEAILERDGAETTGAATPRLAAVLQRLRHAVEALLQDHAREVGRPAAGLLAAPRWLSGVGLERSRLRELPVGALGGEAVRGWPEVVAEDGTVLNLSGGAVAYGAAAVALGLVDAPPNLAPPAARAAWRGERRVAALHAAGLALACLGLVLAGFVLRQRGTSLRAREAEVAALRAARDIVPEVVVARGERDQAYIAAAPMLYLQKRTRDFVTGARLLRERRTTGDFWFALVTDAETYRAGTLPQGSPAAAPETQLLPACLQRPTGLVVELSFRPGGGDALAQVGALISELRAAEHFASVDILPARARQATLADRSVFAAEGADFALQLDAAPFDGVLPGVASPAVGGLFQSRP
jgi:hypothetical protein